MPANWLANKYNDTMNKKLVPTETKLPLVATCTCICIYTNCTQQEWRKHIILPKYIYLVVCAWTVQQM
jgi:hypothetical protein